VGIVVLDAAEGITNQDAHIVGEVIEAGRGLVMLAHKWDLVQDFARAESNGSQQASEIEQTLREDFAQLVSTKLDFASFAQLLFTSVVTGEGLIGILPTAKLSAEQHSRQVDPAALDNILREAVAAHQPPSRKGLRLRIYSIEQVATGPPTLVVRVNDPKLMHFSYERYLINQLRKGLDLVGTPIRLLVRSRSRQRGG